MRVNFGEDLDRNDSGKHKFLSRLSFAFEQKGVKIVNGKSDIFLHLGRNLEKCRAKKKIMRLDGLILNIEQSYKKMNKGLKSSIDWSDGVIYQSQFCKDAYENFLGIDKLSTVILNGADPNEFLPRKPQNFFISICKWRPHKRLEDICDSFIYSVENGLDAELIIGGQTSYEVVHPRIKFIGWMDRDKIKQYLSGAIASIHLSWLDWCPNSVIESLVAGCPVIYAKSGGTTEIVNNSGWGIEDKQWNYEPCYLYRPPKIDYKEIFKVYKEAQDQKRTIVREDLYINRIAEQYISFFERVLNG